MDFYSPAKLNLFFRVLSKRGDGYHEIASLFQAVDLFDRLFFERAERDLITCTRPDIPCDKSNLVHKALLLFRERFSFDTPVHIHIEKHIPVQAGLGGGSSNAATTLWALNEWAGRPASLSELIGLGALIGSDVPFFFSDGTAYCTGRGELLAPFTLPHSLRGWIAKPTFGLSTPAVYQNTRVEEFSLRDPRSALKNFPTFFNDLEIPAFRLEPRLIALQAALRGMGFSDVVMTGSGTAFFCLGVQVPKALEGVAFSPFQTVGRGLSWYKSH
jgi:4-diphosphocytidyl-2-C-methyl-D-erythritol kinase